MQTILKQILSSKHRCRPEGNYVKTSITIHSTANVSSTSVNERNWLDNPSNDRYASWHYCIDENSIIQAIPENEEAWHCGNSKGNKYSIGIEICESGNRKKVLENAAEFVAQRLKSLGLKETDIKQHHDWTGKNCPRILIDKAFIKENMDWNYFIKRVKFYMDGSTMTVEKAKDIIQKKCGFSNDTMLFLSSYKYADSLFTRLAEQMK